MRAEQLGRFTAGMWTRTSFDERLLLAESSRLPGDRLRGW